MQALLSQLLRGQVSGTDHRLSDATLRAFDQWFSGQVDSVRRASAGQRPTASDDSDSGSSAADQRHASVDRDPDSWRSSSTGELQDGDDRHGHHSSGEHHSPPLLHTFDAAYDHSVLMSKSVKQLPVLPNRNAVYVADAILPPEPIKGSRDDRYRNGVNGKTDYDSDAKDDLEVVLPASSPPPVTETQMEMEFINDDKEDHVSPKMDTFAQEEATDLSLPKQNGDRKSSHGSRDEISEDAGAADYLSTGGSSGSEGGSGTQSPMMQAPAHGIIPPPHNFLLNPSAAIAAGLFSPPSPSFPPFYHQRALQLAAMSRAATLGLPFQRKDAASVASKPGMRSAHGYVPGAYGNSTSNIYTGKIVRIC